MFFARQKIQNAFIVFRTLIERYIIPYDVTMCDGENKFAIIP
jgi:hypothetical protein